MTTVKTDLHETVNDSELTKESLKKDKEKMKTDIGFQHFNRFISSCIFIRPHLKETMQVVPFTHHLLVLMRAGLKATVKSYVFKVYYSTSTVEMFSEVMHILNEKFGLSL